MTGLKRLAKDIHYSLFCLRVTGGEREFYSMDTWMARDRRWVPGPGPQVMLQLDQEPQDDQTQSWGRLEAEREKDWILILASLNPGTCLLRYCSSE